MPEPGKTRPMQPLKKPAVAHRPGRVHPLFRASVGMTALGVMALFGNPGGSCGLFGPSTAHASTEFKPFATLRTYSTEHFRIVYDDSEGLEQARHIGKLAEEIRVEVLETLQLPDPGIYDILIIDNYDTANGSATGFPTRIMRLFLNGPLPPITGSSDLSDSMGESWLRELITHEYTHAVQLNYFTGWALAWKYIFYSNAFGLIYPGWFIEGLATAVETHNSSRGRGKTTATDMFLRTAAVEDTLLTPGQWNGINAWPRAGARYLYGGAFLTYVHQRFGPGSFKRVLEAANNLIPFLDDLRPGPFVGVFKGLGMSHDRAENLRFGGIELAFKVALGVPLSTVIDDWEQQLRSEAFNDNRIILEAGVSKLERLSEGEGSTRSPVISPDGQLVAYVGGGDNDVRGIYLVPTEGGRPQRLLARDDLFGGMNFSPDGERLVYARLFDTNRPLDRALGRADLFSFDLRSREEKRLTTGQRLRDPAFSPDGSYMVAIRTAQGKTTLMRLEADGSSPIDLLAPDPTYQLAQPVISPDGRRIAMSVFVQQDPPNKAQYVLGIFDVDSGDLKLIPGNGTSREPTWLDDTHLLFSSDRTGVFNLYSVDLKDGTVRPVTNVLTGVFQPQVYRFPKKLNKPPLVIARAYAKNGFGIYRLEPDPRETLALLGTGPNRRVPSLGDYPRLEVGAKGPRPALPEQLNIPPLTITPPVLGDRPYYALQGLRLASYSPVLAFDEGSRASGYANGIALGASARFVDALERHALNLEATVGVFSRRPSWSAVYRNEVLGFPITAYGQEVANSVGTVTILDQRLSVWERSTGGGLQLSLPWTEGSFFASLTFSGALSQYERFFAVRDALETGTYTSQSVLFSMGHYHANVWRDVAQGQFLDLRATQRLRWRAPLPELAFEGDDAISTPAFPNSIARLYDPGWELYGGYSARSYVGQGTLDLELAAGQVFQADDLRVGGLTGTWSLPGISSADPLTGAFVSKAVVSISQDLWRPEFAVGQLPLLLLQRVELDATLGGALGLDRQYAWQSGGFGTSVGLTAWMYALRSSFRLAPSVRLTYDLQGGITGWYVNIEGLSASESNGIERDRLKRDRLPGGTYSP